MRILVPITALLAIGLVLIGFQITNGGGLQSGTSPSDIAHRSIDAMATVRDVHAAGSSMEREVEIRDLNSAGSWRIHGDCVASGSATISRLSVQGRETGLHPKLVDEQYIVRATRYEPSSWHSWAVWLRAARPDGGWRRAGVTHDTRFVSSMCPSLIVQQLRAYLPGPVEDLGTVRLGSRTAVHLQSSFDGQGGGYTVDLYVDRATYRWVRVGLSRWGAGCCHSYSTTFDYSRYNTVVGIKLPLHTRT